MNVIKYISLVISILTLGLIQNSYAQSTKVQEAITALQATDFHKAQMAIDLASNTYPTNNQAKTWYYKSFIYKELYKNTINNDYVNTTLQSVEKCIKLDTTQKYLASVKDIAKFVLASEKIKSTHFFNDKEYNKAYTIAINILKWKSTLQFTYIDTTTTYIAGISAYIINNNHDAILYLNQSIELAYNNPMIYFTLSDIYIRKNEIENANKILNLATETYPTDTVLANIKIVHLKNTKQTNELINALKISIPLFKNNISKKILLAKTYEELAQKDEVGKNLHLQNAKKIYIEVLSSEDNNLIANIGLGIIYYNQAVEIINKQRYDIDVVTLNQIQDESVLIFKKALPYMLKAYNVDQLNYNTLEGLSGIYFGLNDIPNSNKYKEELNKIKKK